ncbi:aspartyl protease family protein [Sphingobacterium sp. SRCM116780]|uniref:aspartyl protease family protein n=1 Tax=Sphingobacterium sp. SRCM116780 TaxID=2907623 RepID=UPI001F37D4FD|nr:aspartyl protease family protein [Sphingobacterium sp. SRCM116780]UIR54892.1 aspartyl protease family protein [Sphingobacterium sp. SRCM116780]
MMRNSNNYKWFCKICLISCFCFFLSNAYAQETTVLPYKVVANKMIVEVVLNGKEVPMIFDTGGRNSISTRLKKELQTPLLQSRELTDANNNKMMVEEVTVDQVKTIDGFASFNNISFFVFDSELFDCLGVEGFIGSDLLQQNTIEINDQTKQITIKKGGTPSLRSNRQTLSFLPDAKGMPIINLNIGSTHEARVLFDTGSDGLLTFKTSEFTRLHQEGALQITREGQGGGAIAASGRGNAGKQIEVGVPEIVLGGTHFVAGRAKVSNSPETLFGYQSLTYGKVTIDYVNQLLRFEPFNKGQVTLEPKKIWDLQLAVIDNKLVIATVWDNVKGKAEVGDIVTHINGKQVKPMDFCESITQGMPVLKENDQVVLTVKTKTGIKDITITKS